MTDQPEPPDASAAYAAIHDLRRSHTLKALAAALGTCMGSINYWLRAGVPKRHRARVLALAANRPAPTRPGMKLPNYESSRAIAPRQFRHGGRAPDAPAGPVGPHPAEEPRRHMRATDERCNACGGPLSRYNRDRRCYACLKVERDGMVGKGRP